MYDDTPGIDNKKEEGREAADHEHKSEYDNGGENKSSEEQGDDSLSFERKVGDDDAAAASQRMLAGNASSTRFENHYRGGST